MRKSDYTFNTSGDIVEIIDLDLGGVSVTNDAEGVLTEINKYHQIENKRIVYRDSEYVWCELIPTWDCGVCVDVDFKDIESQ